ncbi:MAG: proton-conducting transporter membrane subunit [Pirellulaceae bacterium]
MTELHLPWLELAVVLPLAGALFVSRLRDAQRAQWYSVVFAGLTLLATVGEWLDFATLGVFQAHDEWDLLAGLVGPLLVVDELSAPLLPLAALLYLLTSVATMKTKVRRVSFAWTLVSEAILLATLACKDPAWVIGLLAAGTVPPWVELRRRKKPTNVYVLHMALFVALMVAGWGLVSNAEPGSVPSMVGIAMLIAAALLRSGIIPVHCWMTDLFEHASFGTALLYVTPMVGAYAAVRLVLPIAPAWALRSIALMSLITAVYAAGMALVQREARRFFCYLFLSHSSLVLVGLEVATPIGMTGALCVWLSVGLALAGFGLTLRALEARTGRVSLADFHGLYEHTPTLAALFLLTGLASVGFPGTFGFVGTELLIDGAVQVYPHVGTAVVLAAGLNGIAVLHAYFKLFTGTRHVATISLRSRLSERVAVLILAGLILGGGLFPQPGIASRYHAAMQLVRLSPAFAPSDNESHVGHEVAGASPEQERSGSH